MWFFKACPKCCGDMYVDRDAYGTFVECLQCGLLRDVKGSVASISYGSPREVGELLTGQSLFQRLSA